MAKTFVHTGCRTCKACMGGTANLGRMTVLWIIGICTCGLGLLFWPFVGRCGRCHHKKFMNEHGSGIVLD